MSNKRAARRRWQRSQPKVPRPTTDRMVVIEPGDALDDVVTRAGWVELMYGGPVTIVSQRTFDAIVASGWPLVYVKDNDHKP